MPRFLARLAGAIVLAAAALPASATEIVVSAAASLANAFQEISSDFEKQTGIHVALNIGASGALLQQIAKGAPVDVFASADEQTMDEAQQRSLLEPGSRRTFTANRLVVIVPVDAQTVPARLSDLLQPRFGRLAIGQPASVPAGRYAQAALRKAGLWAPLEPRTIPAVSVRQALDYVARAEVDAGFVYASDAALMPDKVRTAFEVPANPPVRYPVAAVAGTAPRGQKEAASRFIAYLLSPAAQTVLARHGFDKP